jgi:hypothetical protein
LTIDEKISESEIIVIGEVTTAFPTKWKLDDMKDVKDATPQEIIDAGGLFTDFLISIDRVLKGSVGDPTIRVRSFSGETNKVRWKNSSQPEYVENKLYLLFLRQDSGPTAKVDPGDFISVNSNTAVYEIVDGKAISADDEWVLEELIAYIENSLAQRTDYQETITSVGNIPNSPEARAVVRAVEKSYSVKAEVRYTLDIEKLSSIFVNDPRFPVSPDTLETIRELTGNPELESAGLLDNELAHSGWRRDSILYAEALHEKAKKETRDLTEEERTSLIDPQGRTAPARAESPVRTTQLVFISINIENDIADVIVQAGSRQDKLFLVLIGNQWFVAGRNVLAVSP